MEEGSEYDSEVFRLLCLVLDLIHFNTSTASKSFLSPSEF